MTAFFPLPFFMRLAGFPAAGSAVASISHPTTDGRRGDEAARREDAQWVADARDGDPDAFRRLVDRYGDQAFETALRIVRSHEEAEEVTQDAFIRAWRALEGFRGDARFSTWLYRIVTRRALDVAARGKRKRERETPQEPEWIEAHAPASSGSGLAGAELRRLDRVLARLDPVPRAAVTLLYLRDRSVAEIAEILDLPEGTVKTHLHRARAKLRREWEREETQERNRGLPNL